MSEVFVAFHAKTWKGKEKVESLKEKGETIYKMVGPVSEFSDKEKYVSVKGMVESY